MGGPGSGRRSGGGGFGKNPLMSHFRLLDQRLAAGNLKRGERKLLERRREKLAQKIMTGR